MPQVTVQVNEIILASENDGTNECTDSILLDLRPWNDERDISVEVFSDGIIRVDIDGRSAEIDVLLFVPEK